MSPFNPPTTKDGHTDVAERLPSASNQPADSQQSGNQGQQVSTSDGQVVNLGINGDNLRK